MWKTSSISLTRRSIRTVDQNRLTDHDFVSIVITYKKRSDAFKVSEFGHEIDVKLTFIRKAESRIRFDGSVALPQSHTTNKVSSATKHPLPGSRSKILVLFPRLWKTLGRGVLLEGTFA